MGSAACGEFLRVRGIINNTTDTYISVVLGNCNGERFVEIFKFFDDNVSEMHESKYFGPP